MYEIAKRPVREGVGLRHLCNYREAELLKTQTNSAVTTIRKKLKKEH